MNEILSLCPLLGTKETDIYTCVFMCLSVCMCVWIYVCMCAFVCFCVCMHTQMHRNVVSAWMHTNAVCACRRVLWFSTFVKQKCSLLSEMRLAGAHKTQTLHWGYNPSCSAAPLVEVEHNCSIGSLLWLCFCDSTNVFVHQSDLRSMYEMKHTNFCNCMVSPSERLDS